MAQRLKNKVALVTGGGGGIGRAVAIDLAAEGAAVVANDVGRDADGNRPVDKVVAEIKQAGGAAVANYDNIATMQGGENAVKAALDNYGRIDILVTCAGNFKIGRVLDMTEEDWDSVLTVHLKGHFSCAKAAAKEMVKQKSGRIITFSSRASFNFASGPGGSRSIAYSTAKAGVLGLTAVLSAELKEYGITANAMLPAAVTDLFPSLMRGGAGFGAKKREGPEYVAPVVTYLATDEAQNINGQYIYAAGGELCIYDRPLQLPGPHMFVSKVGKWTVDELIEIVPSIVTT